MKPKDTEEMGTCRICHLTFVRKKTSNPRKVCYSKKCEAHWHKLKTLGHEKPVSLKSIRNDCGKYRGDIDYYGSVHP